MAHGIRPGVHRFVVSSFREASFQLVRPRAGYTKHEAARDVNKGLNQGNVKVLKRFERNITLVGGVATSRNHDAVMWVNLPRGTYWAVDTDTSTTLASQLRTVRVRGHRTAGSAPHGTVIRAVRDTSWATHPASMRHQGLMTFRNASHDNHFVILAKLAPGKTLSDFKAWVDQAKQGQQSPPPLTSTELDTGVVSPGHAMTMRYSLPRGNYVLMCFWPDADMGGMPHVFMGMYRGMKLT
jgi:hypothetical protein